MADDLPRIKPDRESLQLLFLLICAENISKLYHNFNKEGKSRIYTRKFFEEIVPQQEREYLKNGFRHNIINPNQKPLTLREIIDFLYDVRCDVVHEGKYWQFFFSDGKMSMQNIDPDVTVNITLTQFRNIVVKVCIEAVKGYKQKPYNTAKGAVGRISQTTTYSV
ncbi:MAG: hypothetical protein FVQ81_02665 [Candidatus Glassbacteria bacterium]|nr:hypothetical protein [Candidatus Glassbacteria bacterium]